jgi:hypothetical protein
VETGLNVPTGTFVLMFQLEHFVQTILYFKSVCTNALKCKGLG